MEPIYRVTNHMDVFLTDAWGSFVRHVQGRQGHFVVSRSLTVTLKALADDGTVMDVGGYDMGGPSRAFLNHLMTAAGDLPILVGGEDDKLLKMDYAGEYCEG